MYLPTFWCWHFWNVFDYLWRCKSGSSDDNSMGQILLKSPLDWEIWDYWKMTGVICSILKYLEFRQMSTETMSTDVVLVKKWQASGFKTHLNALFTSTKCAKLQFCSEICAVFFGRVVLCTACSTRVQLMKGQVFSPLAGLTSNKNATHFNCS